MLAHGREKSLPPAQLCRQLSIQAARVGVGRHTGWQPSSDKRLVLFSLQKEGRGSRLERVGLSDLILLDYNANGNSFIYWLTF